MLICDKCKYEWNYKGNKLYATCPSCLRKQKIKLISKGKTPLSIHKLSDEYLENENEKSKKIRLFGD